MSHGEQRLGSAASESEKNEMDHALIAAGQWADGTVWEFVAQTELTQFPDHKLCTAVFCIPIYVDPYSGARRVVIVEHSTRGFEFPGGHIEEDLMTALARELMEEAGVKINESSLQYIGHKRVSPPSPIPKRDSPGEHYPFPHSFLPYFLAFVDEIFLIPLSPDVRQVKIVTFEEAVALLAAGHHHDTILSYAKKLLDHTP